MTEKNFTLGDNVEHFTIADVARDNPDFRKVLWTGEHAQIVVMTIPPGGEIGDEEQGPNLGQRFRWQGFEPCAWGGPRGTRTPDIHGVNVAL